MKKWRPLLLLLPLIAGAFYLRSLASWRPKQVFDAPGVVSMLAFSSDDKTLLVGYGLDWSGFHSYGELSPATTLVLLDTRNGFKPLWEHKNDVPLLGQPEFFAHDTQILVCGQDIQILDASTGKTRIDYGKLPGRAVMSPDGKWLAYNALDIAHRATIDGRIYLNPAVAKRQHPPTITAERTVGKRSDTAPQFACSPDGKTFVEGVGDQDRAHLDFYDVKTWNRTHIWNEFKGKFLGDSPYYKNVQWSRDGKFILSSWRRWNSGNTESVSLWRVSDGKKIASTSLQSSDYTPTLELQNGGQVLSFSTMGQVYLSAVKAATLDLKSQQIPLNYLAQDEVLSTALSPDGSYLVVGTQSGRVFWQRVK